MKDPWFKFYPSDWRGDPSLRVISLAARGLWMEMLCIMHESEPYGHLLINGHPVTETQLASLTGAIESTVSQLLKELEISGAFSRGNKGVIYSRRMTRDFKRTRQARKNGKGGGNPSLCKNKGIYPSVNPPDNIVDKPQTPDAIFQIPDINTPPLVSNSPREEGGGLKNGIGNGVFRIENHLDDDAIMEARRNAPGWDVYQLMRVYDEGISQRGIPRLPSKAFPAWCASYTKGKPP